MNGDATVGRYAAVDVHYGANSDATAALVIAADPTFATIIGEHTAHVTNVGPYTPGAFYLRELPALRAVLAGAGRLDLLIVDGYVTLDAAGRPGLGAHAHTEFGVPVIGIAKSRFRSATHAIEVQRGIARRPLFVTAAGLPVADAAELVRHMAGPHRIPTALRRVDGLARKSGAS